MGKDKKYISKKELSERWSKSLIEKYFPIPSMEKRNPCYHCSSPMQLYELSEVIRIEGGSEFMADFEKVKKRKGSAIKATQTKHDKLIDCAKNIRFNIPTFEKEILIKKACYHYNERNAWKERCYDDYFMATPSSDEEFLKRITINYLRHQCTCYEDKLDDFFNKVGVQEAHDILQSRINEAIKQKYEWLR